MPNRVTRYIRQILSPFNFKAKWKVKKEFTIFNSLIKSEERFILNFGDRLFINNEKTVTTGFDRHYVYHTSWAARCVQKIAPEVHKDISSSLYFCGIVSAFCKTEFFDYRPAELILSNLSSGKADLTNLYFADSSVKSLSCMHTIEHVGLGRYGDPFDYDGDIKALNELKRVVAPGGSLLIVVPVGKESKIIFNAHRIYHPSLILSYFGDFELVEFCMIPENASDGGLVIDPGEELIQTQNYACGCYWFKKR